MDSLLFKTLVRTVAGQRDRVGCLALGQMASEESTDDRRRKAPTFGMAEQFSRDERDRDGEAAEDLQVVSQLANDLVEVRGVLEDRHEQVFRHLPTMIFKPRVRDRVAVLVPNSCDERGIASQTKRLPRCPLSSRKMVGDFFRTSKEHRLIGIELETERFDIRLDGCERVVSLVNGVRQDDKVVGPARKKDLEHKQVPIGESKNMVRHEDRELESHRDPRNTFGRDPLEPAFDASHPGIGEPIVTQGLAHDLRS